MSAEDEQRIEMLVWRYGTPVVLTGFDSVAEVEAVAEMAIEHFPGPWAPVTIFVDEQARPLWENDRQFERNLEQYEAAYAAAEREEH